MEREKRDPNASWLERKELKTFLRKVETNHEDTVILKLKDHLAPDFINPLVLNLIIEAIGKNTVCQALYVQNLSNSMNDEQLFALVEVLKRKKIWCINLGENYSVSQQAWLQFTSSLKDTMITHMYVSEHIIPLELKNRMRDEIRENRKKNTLHCSKKNIDVIERCTHCWWNPINAIKHQEELKEKR